MSGNFNMGGAFQKQEQNGSITFVPAKTDFKEKISIFEHNVSELEKGFSALLNQVKNQKAIPEKNLQILVEFAKEVQKQSHDSNVKEKLPHQAHLQLELILKQAEKLGSKPQGAEGRTVIERLVRIDDLVKEIEQEIGVPAADRKDELLKMKAKM